MCRPGPRPRDRKSTRLNSSHVAISYAVFCLKKKTNLSINDLRRFIILHTSCLLRYIVCLLYCVFVLFIHPAPTDLHTLSLHDALPISSTKKPRMPLSTSVPT